MQNDSDFYQIEVKLASTTVFVVLDLDDTVHVLTHEGYMCGQWDWLRVPRLGDPEFLKHLEFSRQGIINLHEVKFKIQRHTV